MALNQRQRDVLANSTSTGALPLGAHAGNVTSCFSAGHSFDTPGGGHAARASGKNHANPAPKHGGSGSLNFSNKDGQRQAGEPKLSGSTKGPKGRTKKSKGISGR